jgi:hypothetical protein
MSWWKIYIPHQKIIHETDPIPRGYGVSHYRPGFDQIVCYPIPFNLLVPLFREAWHFIKVPTWYLKRHWISKYRATLPTWQANPNASGELTQDVLQKAYDKTREGIK